ncbi:MAG TPA: hypothetical protein PKA81_02565 [Clostridia bacterium]|nr:hypothetical protein [Clostridia bacterium]
MRYTINADPKRITGKRPNLSEQNSVADEIVTAFSSQQEQPIMPLSSTATGKPSPWGKIYAIIAAALLFAPFLIATVWMILSGAQGYALPALMLPILALGFRTYSFVGGLVLYLAARKANFLRRTVGWIALANLLVTVPFFILAFQSASNPDAAALATNGMQIANTVSIVASLLCMIALCVFAVLMLMRVFRKKKQELPA